MQAPYLFFYPDRNGDDVPDSDPEVLLSGFGKRELLNLHGRFSRTFLK